MVQLSVSTATGTDPQGVAGGDHRRAGGVVPTTSRAVFRAGRADDRPAPPQPRPSHRDRCLPGGSRRSRRVAPAGPRCARSGARLHDHRRRVDEAGLPPRGTGDLLGDRPAPRQRPSLRTSRGRCSTTSGTRARTSPTGRGSRSPAPRAASTPTTPSARPFSTTSACSA